MPPRATCAPCPGAGGGPGLHLRFRDELGGGTDTQQHQGSQRQGVAQQPASQLCAHLKNNRKSGLICLAVLHKATGAIIKSPRNLEEEKRFPGSSSQVSLSHPEHFLAKKKKHGKRVKGWDTDPGELCFHFFLETCQGVFSA